jgi:hypothetical protein
LNVAWAVAVAPPPPGAASQSYRSAYEPSGKRPQQHPPPDYSKKYLKYKTKYLNLLKQLNEMNCKIDSLFEIVNTLTNSIKVLTTVKEGKPIDSNNDE